MTISYQRDVASSTAGGFTRLLFKWKERPVPIPLPGEPNCTKRTKKTDQKHLLFIELEHLAPSSLVSPTIPIATPILGYLAICGVVIVRFSVVLGNSPLCCCCPR